jgi:threonine/homoserine/homoserine lactone efflux protein
MSNFFLFLLAAIALNITPGPDVLYVTARSLSQGRKAGIVSAVGLGVGYLIHTTAAAVGISALLASSVSAYLLLKYVGAAYLIYLGIRTIFNKTEIATSSQFQSVSSTKLFWQGFLTSILNPKVAIFFLAFLPQFVDRSSQWAIAQILFLGITFTFTATVWNTFVAVFIGSFGTWLKHRPTFSQVLQWLSGSVLIALGIRVAVPEKN